MSPSRAGAIRAIFYRTFSLCHIKENRGQLSIFPRKQPKLSILERGPHNAGATRRVRMPSAGASTVRNRAVCETPTLMVHDKRSADFDVRTRRGFGVAIWRRQNALHSFPFDMEPYRANQIANGTLSNFPYRHCDRKGLIMGTFRTRYRDRRPRPLRSSHVPKSEKMAEICGCEWSIDSI